MMWVAISYHRKMEFVHVPDNLTAQSVKDEILQPNFMHVIDRQKLVGNWKED